MGSTPLAGPGFLADVGADVVAMDGTILYAFNV